MCHVAISFPAVFAIGVPTGNDLIVILAVWILSLAVGAFVGGKRHQLLSGVLLTLLLGPLGLLILFLLPNEKQENEDYEKRLGSLEQQLYSQRDEQTQQMLEQANAVRQAKPDASQEIVLRVAREGKDLGEMKLEAVKTMLREGQLAPEDFFLDTASNEWMPLDCHPSLIG